YGKNGQLEFDLIVGPGADPSAVRRAVAGGFATLEATGDLKIGIGDAAIVLHRPVSYQLVDGARREVDSSFMVLADNEISIAVGTYDPSAPLIIDPALTYASYFGCKGLDVSTAIAVDAAGNMYITGSSASPDLPLV